MWKGNNMIYLEKRWFRVASTSILLGTSLLIIGTYISFDMGLYRHLLALFLIVLLTILLTGLIENILVRRRISELIAQFPSKRQNITKEETASLLNIPLSELETFNLEFTTQGEQEIKNVPIEKFNVIDKELFSKIVRQGVAFNLHHLKEKTYSFNSKTISVIKLIIVLPVMACLYLHLVPQPQLSENLTQQGIIALAKGDLKQAKFNLFYSRLFLKNNWKTIKATGEYFLATGDFVNAYFHFHYIYLHNPGFFSENGLLEFCRHQFLFVKTPYYDLWKISLRSNPESFRYISSNHIMDSLRQNPDPEPGE